MHLSDFIVTVQRGNGDSLPESTTRTLYDLPLSTTRSCTTYLPFDSEYRLYFKNNSFKEAVVFVKIDGIDVLGKYGLRVPSHTTATLERFLVDGDLSKGKRFKFVSVSDERVSDPTNDSNGLIEVTVKFEKPYFTTWSWSSCPSFWSYPSSGSAVPPPSPEYRGEYYIGDPLPGQEPKIMCNSVSFSAGLSSSYRTSSLSGFVAERASASQKGATVEGSDSNQSFSTTYMRDLESESLVFKFQLLAPKERVSIPSIRVVNNPVKYCSNCGVKLDRLTNFCSNCGQKLL